MNIAYINVLTLKIIRDTIQTRLTNLLKRLDLELEQRLQIKGDKKRPKNMLRRDLVADPEIFCLASYATCKQPKY